MPERQGHPNRVAAEMLAQGRALRRRHNLIDAGRTTPSAHRVDRVTQSKLITYTHKRVQANSNNKEIIIIIENFKLINLSEAINLKIYTTHVI